MQSQKITVDFESLRRGEKEFWSKMRFGCCASKDDVDDGRQAFRDNGEHEMQIVYDQPQSIAQPRAQQVFHARPSTSQSMGRHVSRWVDSSRDFATRASSRASFSTLTRPRTSHSVHKGRPSISRPTNFQHFDNGLGSDAIQSMVNDASMPVRRNRSFRRLELSIYLPDGCGRLSPLPDFKDKKTWPNGNRGLEKPAQALVRVRDSRTSSLSSNPSTSEYLIQRKPVPSASISIAHSRHSSVLSQMSYGTTTTHERRLSGTTINTMQTPLLSTWSGEARASSDSIVERPAVRRARTSGGLSPARVLSRLPSPSRSRANTAPSRHGSLRRTKTDVDEAIRELNTIVEERRASAYRLQIHSPALTNRPPPSSSHHVPNIAPTMRMHVRSETLSDIGSAFSAPLATNKSLPITPVSGTSTPRRRTTNLILMPSSRDSTMALCPNPIAPPGPNTPERSTSRLTSWLHRSMSNLTTSTSPSISKPSDSASPFYKCEPAQPSSGDSHAMHSRQNSQDSNATATVTLFSASPDASQSDLTSRTATPDLYAIPPKSPLRLLKSKRNVPAPLVLVKEADVVPALRSGIGAGGVLVPPMSPNVDILRGMEILAKDVGMGVGERRSFGMPSPGAVGVAF